MLIAARRTGVLTLMALAFAAGAPSANATPSPLLPDMGMAQLSRIYIDTTTQPGHRLLRYTAILVNVGAGPLQLTGTRPDTTTPRMAVTQRIFNSDGSVTDQPTTLTMFYAGDGHNHWHTTDIESGSFTKLDGTQVGALAKEGFCFSDNVEYRLTLPGAPQVKHYTGSGCKPNNPLALTATEGLSVGWGDRYSAGTNLQWIDITGLPKGTYKLTATADPGGQLMESDYTNNSVWAIIKLTSGGKTVLEYGPGA